MLTKVDHPLLRQLKDVEFVRHVGRVTRVLPGVIEASGPNVGLGTVCEINRSGGGRLQVEVVGAGRSGITMMPYADTEDVCVGDRVCAASRSGYVGVGSGFLGRAVNGLGEPIDGGPPIVASVRRRSHGDATKPMQRATAPKVVETKVRAIDTLLTLATGQRVGVFAGSGVGKTTLVNALARNIDADVKVICLVGERGRETAEYWRHNVSDSDRSRTVLVATTSEQPAVLRARAVNLALVLAEYFRDQRKHVLFMMDSITRYAMALREIGLAVGEPPTARAYTPSVFAALPKVVERCGAHAGGGAITGIFSVLAESDDIEDPLSETMRSLLDGHVLLSRQLAEQGHYPAIDIARSVSRMMTAVAGPKDIESAHTAVAAMATYDKTRILIDTGAYKAGSSEEVDRAVAMHPALMKHLAQDLILPVGREIGLQALAQLVGGQRAN